MNSSNAEEQSYWTTAEFAAANMVKPASVIKRLCQTGSYFGILAEKLLNGRLRWPKRVAKT